MLVTLLLLLVLALRTSVVSMISRVSSTLVVVSTMTIDLRGTRQQLWSHVQQYESDGSWTLVLHDSKFWLHTRTVRCR